MTKPLPIDYIQEYLSYDPSTGVITWKKSPRRTSLKGKEAGCIDKAGYRKIVLLGKEYAGHRVAWVLAYGEDPVWGIDHINRDRSDNRLVNLRRADQTLNNLNKGARSNNASGHKGVYWCSRGKYWTARFTMYGITTQTSGHKTLEEAIASRLEMEKESGYQ